MTPDCHKGLPKIERSLTASIVELRRKGLPHPYVRNHSMATKIVLCFAQRYACSACFAGTPGNLDTAQGLNNLYAVRLVLLHLSLYNKPKVRNNQVGHSLQSQSG